MDIDDRCCCIAIGYKKILYLSIAYILFYLYLYFLVDRYHKRIEVVKLMKFIPKIKYTE